MVINSGSFENVRKPGEQGFAVEEITDADGWPVTFRRLGDTLVMQTDGARLTPEALRSMAHICLHAAEEIERDQAMRGTVARSPRFRGMP